MKSALKSILIRPMAKIAEFKYYIFADTSALFSGFSSVGLLST
jgi:hypothetical protein